MNKKITITVEQLIEAAKEAEKLDPIPWEHLNMDSDMTYEEVAHLISYRYSTMPEDERVSSLLATVIFLTVQNWVLETKLGLMD